MISNDVGIKAEWKIFSISKDGETSILSNMERNTILDAGLDYFISNIGTLQLPYSSSIPMMFDSIAVGDGVTPALISDVTLQNELYRYEIEEDYSLNVNNDDTANPFVTLGTIIPAGTSSFVISELGLCNANNILFNRFVITPITKLPDDVLVIQCRITLSRISNSAEISSNVVIMHPFIGNTSAKYNVYNVLMDASLYGLLSSGPSSFTNTGILQIGTSLNIPTTSDTGVTELMEQFVGFPFEKSLYTNHVLRLKFGIEPMSLYNSAHQVDEFTEISITNWPIQMHSVFEWRSDSAISSQLHGLGDLLPPNNYGTTYAPAFIFSLRFIR